MVDLAVLLKAHRARLDDLNERRRLSNDQSDYTQVLGIVEAIVGDLARATLQHLGESARKDVSVEDTVRHLAAAIADRSDRFKDGASVRILSDAVARQEQNLKDIRYLRRGLGSGRGGSRPADMRWDHPSSVVSDVLSTFSRLFDSLRAEGADVEGVRDAPRIDLASTRAGIIKLLAEESEPAEFMRAVVRLGEAQTHVAGWERFLGLPYQDEIDALGPFFFDVVSARTPIRRLAGFYGTIEYPTRGGKRVADLKVTGSESYHSHEVEWPVAEARFANSKILAAIYSQAYEPGGLGNAADYTLCLAWGSYLARACARRYLAETDRDFIAVRVGFSDGDWIDLGRVRST